MRQATDLLDGLIPGGEEGKDLTVSVLEKIIVFAIMWSLGSLLELDDRKKVCKNVERRLTFKWMIIHKPFLSNIF